MTYKKVGNLRLLLRTYWMDLVMPTLVPFLFIKARQQRCIR
ncbi:MAG: hypothetical protein ACK4FV_00455 [Candidatus Nitrosocaldus sp.]